MRTIQKSLRIPFETVKEIEKIVHESGRNFSSITKDLLAEAIKMRRCPGIVFTEGVIGRKARVAGTGQDVWEIIATYRSVNNDIERLKKAYHWLTEQQLRSAIGYYNTYRNEIERQIERNKSWTNETISKHYPFLGRGDI